MMKRERALDQPQEQRTISEALLFCQTNPHFSLTSKHFSPITEIDSMKVQRLALAVSLTLLAMSALRAATPQMNVSDIRPGMIGVGRTVFDGTKVEEFRAHIIGVIENVIGTQRNLILAKLEGGPLANTGVIAGMSGSPVYVDGKLIGAVSYALGSFSKEPIAGIRPIADVPFGCDGLLVVVVRSTKALCTRDGSEIK